MLGNLDVPAPYTLIIEPGAEIEFNPNLYLRFTAGGREIYAVGGNEEAARLSGINVNWVRTKAFVIAGVMGAIGGLLMTARLDSGSPNYAQGMELMAIAAAVIGGASLFGGQGSILGTLFGAMTIVIVQNGLNLHGVPAAWLSTTGSGVTVAVLDIGVSAGGPDGFCQGFAGEHDAIRGRSGAGVAADPNGHGTHVTGIIAANDGNGVGVSSVAPGARVLVVRALRDGGCLGSERERRGNQRRGEACVESEKLGARFSRNEQESECDPDPKMREKEVEDGRHGSGL